MCANCVLHTLSLLPYSICIFPDFLALFVSMRDVNLLSLIQSGQLVACVHAFSMIFFFLCDKDFALHWVLTFPTAEYFRLKLHLCCCWTVLVHLRQVWANRQMEALEGRGHHRALCFLHAWPTHSLRWCSKAKETLLFRVLLTWMAGRKATWQQATGKELNHPSSVWFNWTWMFIDLLSSSPLHSMFSQQQASPQFTQQNNNNNMYNSNGMNLNNVTMATNMATSGMGQMAGQMSVTSMASGPSPGLPSMGQEQVDPRAICIHKQIWKWITPKAKGWNFNSYCARRIHLQEAIARDVFIYLFICGDLSIQEFRGFSQSGDHGNLKALFPPPKCYMCWRVMLVNNLLSSLLIFSCWTAGCFRWT